jgi:hypothetical protein
LKIAFELTAKRRQKVTSVDKANVLEVSQLWRPVRELVRGLNVICGLPCSVGDHIWIKQFYIAEFA